MDSREREAAGKFERLLKKPILYQGQPARITSLVFRGNSAFFSLFMNGVEIDIEKGLRDLDVFMNRIILVEDSVPKFRVVRKKREQKSYSNVRVWKNKGVPSFLVFGEDVLTLCVLKDNKYFSVAIPALQEDLEDGKLILAPSDKEHGYSLYTKNGGRVVLPCKSYSQYVRYDKYNVAIGKKQSKDFKVIQYLILTPIL